jgi:hypothetical protein
MNATYSDRARQCAEDFALLQRATKCLEEVLGKSTNDVQAEWDQRQDARGRATYTLRISDWTGSVSVDFTPDELQSPSQVRYRMLRLWGDLLQIRSHKQLEELMGA